VILILIVLIAGAVLVLNQHLAAKPSSTIQERVSEASRAQELVAQPATWTRAKFPVDYKHSVEIWYPDHWFFTCCGDKDTLSNHFVYPVEELEIGSQSHVVVTDYALVGCPPEKPFCNIGELVELTPERRFKSLRQTIEETRRISGVQNLEQIGETILRNLGGSANIYRGVTRYDSTPVELYLINTQSGVIGIFVYGYQQLGREFIAEFLSRIETSPGPRP